MAYLVRWLPFENWSLAAKPSAWAHFFLIATLLVFPLSSTAKSVCLTLSLIAIVCTPNFFKKLNLLLKTSWCKAILLLFGIVLIFCFWSPASWAQKSVSIGKYSKLLYLPVLVIGFQNPSTRRLGINAFLIAMILTCSLSVLKFHGYLQFLTFNPDNVFRNHIMTSLMVSFAAFISFLYCYNSPAARGLRLFYGLLGILFTYQVVFVSGSRTGYLIYLLLMIILVLQLFSWKHALVSALLLVGLFSVSYVNSSVMQTRIQGLVQQTKDYQENNKDTDLGLRLQFHHYAYKLFKHHPLLGNGTASFAYYFHQEKPVRFWTWNLLEPHSQYWLCASEWGLIGLGALLYFFLTLIQTTQRSKESIYPPDRLKKSKVLALGLIISFMVGNLSDSLLFYSGSGYFFIFFIALFLAEESNS